jgi:hypothetical protein
MISTNNNQILDQNIHQEEQSHQDKTSNFSKEANKYFKPIDEKYGNVVIGLLAISGWMVVCKHLHTSLKKTKMADKSFFPVFYLMTLIPVGSILLDFWSVFAPSSVNTHDSGSSSSTAHVPPEYPACLTPTLDLSPELQQAGVLGSIDGRCFATQYDFLKDTTEVIRTKSYNAMYALFSLILVFFAMSKYSSFFSLDNIFVHESIRVASLLSLTLFTVSVIGTYYWYSLYLLRFYSNLVQMDVTVILMLIGYLLYIFSSRIRH